MVEEAMALGASKLALEEMNKKMALGAVDSEINSLAKGLGVTKEVLTSIVIDAVNKELADVNSQITFNSAMSQ